MWEFVRMLMDVNTFIVKFFISDYLILNRNILNIETGELLQNRSMYDWIYFYLTQGTGKTLDKKEG